MKDGEKNMANYTRGDSTNIVVGAAALFLANVGKELSSLGAGGTAKVPGSGAPDFVEAISYKDTLSNSADFKNLGYTSNGLELTFNPSFGEVQVDQLLDVAKLFKSGMQVTLKTTLAEATLENFLLVLAQRGTVNRYGWTYSGTQAATTVSYTAQINTEQGAAHGTFIDLMAGELGDFPVERSLVAIGPGVSGNATIPTLPSTSVTDQKERVYLAYRVINIANVTVAAKRDAATMFDVEFRLLPDSTGAYGKVVDRTF